MTEKTIVLEYSEIQEQIFFDWPEGVKFKVVKKGRRGGFTKGAANFYIDELIRGTAPLLWGDTSLGNIQKYFDRYFEPVLKANNVDYEWSVVNKQLKIGKAVCDFRSADQPDKWEGFGYKIILLNEAGIILKDSDLYVKTILPMLIDFPDAKLIAGGVPKGKKLKTGDEHLFYTLYKRALSEPQRYMVHEMTAYNNPWLDDKDVDELRKEIFAMGGQSMVSQEVDGEFIDRIANNPFIIHFDRSRHVGPTRLDLNKQLFISIDFNLVPFGLIAAHIWFDKEGHHYHRVAELKIQKGSIPAMIDAMRVNFGPWLAMCRITGDRGGRKKELSLRDNASYFDQIRRGLNLRESQIITPANPTHKNSGADVNYVYYNHPDNKIDPSLDGLIFDVENVECDEEGDIIKDNRSKAAQQADLLDCERYMINTFMKDWIKIHQNSSPQFKKP